MAKKQATSKTVEALKHDEATRKNIPTAEYQSVMLDRQDAVLGIDHSFFLEDPRSFLTPCR